VYSDPETLDWAARGCRSAGIGCLDCKRPLIEAINAEQKVMIDRAERFRDQPDLVHAILQEGAEKARDVARVTLEDVRASIGIQHR
ncbi:MAG: tryptophan--tRNA ligase, partial [Gammaproteobacteria bacterium]|nr:tryptophan--tRNA ligase [Gammaproteobacteria bacterium]